jgi:hypothetical protein
MYVAGEDQVGAGQLARIGGDLFGAVCGEFDRVEAGEQRLRADSYSVVLRRHEGLSGTVCCLV